MTKRYARQLRLCRPFVVLAALLLAACAGTAQPAYYPPPDPESYFTISVRSGDTLSEIAYRYQVDDDVLLAMNDIDDPNAIMAGTSLKVPAYGHLRNQNDDRNAPITPRQKPDQRPETAQRAQAEFASRQNGLNDIPIPQPKPAIASAEPVQDASWWGWFGSPATQAPADSTPAVQTPSSRSAKASSSGGSFLWPVSGQVLSAFGSSHGGERNDGINIATARGTPVRAAEAGTVSYVGNELKGYGNLVLIRHDNGFVTAYAHSDSVAVERGERVSRGQIIAYAGATGDVTQPQVHFELRQGTKPVNPAPFLVASN